MLSIKDLKAGESAKIISVGGEGEIRQHFLDMGLIPGAYIRVEKYAPMGDPVEIRISGYELTLRINDAAKIEIEKAEEKEEEDLELNAEEFERHLHPGLGEEGKFHDKKNEHPLADDVRLSFALVGNQNCGKTTLFNQLTGANQHVGNFPGVTVDRKDGVIKGTSATVTDLPGIYSMSPYTQEEIVTRNFVLEENVNGIINIVDATNIERNLYLTMQLIELDKPMVVALNMMDEVRTNGGTININLLEELLGVPVVPISASKKEGIRELVEHLMHVARYQEKPLRQDICSPLEYNGAVHRCLHSVMHLIEDHAERAGIPLRFASSKLVEGDEIILEALDLDENEKEMLSHIVMQMERERGLDRSAAIADMRFSFINRVSRLTVKKPAVSKERIRSQMADRILTGKFTAIPAFIIIMGLVFFLTFNVVGAALSSALDYLIGLVTDSVSSLLLSLEINEVFYSLIIDGIFNGVGSVLSFLPIIVTLFFFLSLLEDSGYMARIAFVMDKLLRKLGLSGRSIVPLLIGFGCSVPAVMASRTLPSERDRKMTILLTPFMSCSAKLPIYAFFTAAFFTRAHALVMIALYLIGIVMGILVALLFKKVLFKGEAVPFVMELPNYRMPGAKNVARLLWEKSKDFIERAFTVIFVATIIIWALQSFDFTLNFAPGSEKSILSIIAGAIAPLFIPLGFASWKTVTSLVSGFMAKESVVSTLSILYGSVEALKMEMGATEAFSFLLFCLLYTPCVAAVTAVKRELGAKWMLFVVFAQLALAYLVSLVFYQVASLF